MREVVVTAVLNVPGEAIEKRLSPASIVEYAGTYEVQSVQKREGKTVVRGGFDQLEITLEFTDLEDGYEYSQVEGSGPFQEMHTWVTLEEGGEDVPSEETIRVPGLESDERTTVRVRSVYTFGGRFARLKDWIAESDRRTELQRLIGNLVDDLAAESESGDDLAAESESGVKTEDGEAVNDGSEDADDVPAGANDTPGERGETSERA